MRFEPRPDLVLGLGERFRRDDGLGLALAQRLDAARLPGLRVVLEEIAWPTLWEHWSASDHVLLLDAARGADPAGTLRGYDLLHAPPEVAVERASSHGIGVVEAVGVAGELDRLPRSLVLVTVTGKDFGFGSSLSPEVEASVPAVVERLIVSLTPAVD